MGQPYYPNYQNYQPIAGQGADDSGARVSTEDASYHTIKVYNFIRDKLWERLDMLNNSEDLYSVIERTKDLRLLLMRADNIWRGIEKSATIKAEALKISMTKFKYNGEFEKAANNLTRYIEFKENLVKYYDARDSEFDDYIILPAREKILYIKNKVEDLVKNIDGKWEEYAADINFGMTLELSQERDPFFRRG